MGSIGTQDIVYMFREIQTKYLVFTAFGRDKQWKEEFMGHTHSLTVSHKCTHAQTPQHTHLQHTHLQHTHTNISILNMFHRKAVLPHFPLQT